MTCSLIAGRPAAEPENAIALLMLSSARSALPTLRPSPIAVGRTVTEDVCDCIQRYGDNIERLTACIEAIILSQGGE